MKQIHKLVHNLFHEAGSSKKGHHDLRSTPIRKYFKNMMDQVVDTYHDIQSKGVQFLRTIYARRDYTSSQVRLFSDHTT